MPRQSTPVEYVLQYLIGTGPEFLKKRNELGKVAYRIFESRNGSKSEI